MYHEWYNSDDYAELKALRLAAASVKGSLAPNS
ncbi:hypothetical protein H6F79_00230 [Trichocoleus sp. FACHB-69]|nr:hypothetical protein [Trichocoleus sp. FACHB-69]